MYKNPCDNTLFRCIYHLFLGRKGKTDMYYSENVAHTHSIGTTFSVYSSWYFLERCDKCTLRIKNMFSHELLHYCKTCKSETQETSVVVYICSKSWKGIMCETIKDVGRFKIFMFNVDVFILCCTLHLIFGTPFLYFSTYYYLHMFHCFHWT